VGPSSPATTRNPLSPPAKSRPPRRLPDSFRRARQVLPSPRAL